MLRLVERWAWDSWLAAEGGEHHLFFLCAPRALGDPDRRHDHAAIGHAKSADLRDWEVLPDALAPAEAPAWDDLALWTGSVARAPDGWRMFYTGRCRADGGRVQRIGRAASRDLVTWERTGGGPLLEADPRWYATSAWRDPSVLADPGGDGWHMLITAHDLDGRGVIGHARSADLEAWEMQPPLTRAAGFEVLEVPRVASVDGNPVLMFSCASRVWVARGESLLGPWDVEGATALGHASLYAANFVGDDSGGWSVLGFRDIEDGEFVGEIADPLPIERHGRTVRLNPAGR